MFKYKDKSYTISGRRENYFRELEIMELIKAYNLKNSMIDCGANYGNHTVFFGCNTEIKKIYSFEPMPDIYPVLQQNIKDNGLEEKVTSYNFAVGNKQKKLKLISEIKNTQGAFWFWYHDEKPKHPRDMGYHQHKEGTKKEIYVDSIRIDDFLNLEEKIDFMKIDVEGMELEVLKGSKKTIEEHRPILYIETCLGSVKEMQIWILNNGYRKVKNSCLFGHHWLLEPK